MLEDDEIRDVFVGMKDDPVRTCDELITASLARGGIDNVTAIVIAPT